MPNAFRSSLLLTLAALLWGCSNPTTPEPPSTPPEEPRPSGALSPLPTDPVTYTRDAVTLTDVGTFDGSRAEFFAVNNDGVAVGRYNLGGYRGVVWFGGSDSQELTDSLGAAIIPYDINNYGVVSGYRKEDLCGIRWPGAGNVEYLQALDQCGQAFGLNNRGANHRGQIVGGIFAPAGTGDTAFQVALWDTAGSLEVLGGRQANGLDINDQQVVIGSGQFPDGTFGCLVWTRQQGLMKTTEYAPGLDCAEAISHDGTLAGWVETGDDATAAAVWTEEGGVQTIGTLGGSSSGAFGINELGEVVGWSRTSDNSLRAFYWKAGSAMTDLGTLPDGGASAALDINDDGLIVGRAKDASGANHAVTWRVSEGVLELELRVDKTRFDPVIAQCFNAVTQKAEWGFACDCTPEQQEKGDCTLPRKATRTDRTDVEVIVQRNGEPVEGVDVRLSVEPVDSTAGHLHADPSRPPGRYLVGDSLPDETTLTTDAEGRATVPYQTSGVSGQEKLKAAILDEEGEPLGGEGQTRKSTIQIGLSLEPMTRDPGEYYWFADGTTHGRGMHNHYTKLASRDSLIEIFKEYFAKTQSGSRFQPDTAHPSDRWNVFVITQASLEYGGLLDLGHDWRNPHMLHRTGKDFDLRLTNIPNHLRNRFYDFCDKHGAKCVKHGNHIHATMDHTTRQRDGYGELR